jgi:hypothetical protein
VEVDLMADKTGTCTFCGKRCRYVRLGSGGAVWVHDDTGHYISRDPERHDCNTHIKRDGAER